MDLNELSIVVLAAGQGTRMKSPLPKVLHPIGGKPMISHVIQTATQLNPKQILVVYGFGGEEVCQAVDEPGIIWVKQPDRLGTGDAVGRALPHLTSNQRVLILYGDVPLIALETLQRLLSSTPINCVGLLTVMASDPTGLGRIVRSKSSEVTQIVEERDANDIERQIHEVNTGIFVVPSTFLQKWLPSLKNNNAQSEYYLTDIIQFAVQDGVKIMTSVPSVAEEVLGVNDKSQQMTAERFYQRQRAEQLLRDGVTIFDPARFDLRGSLEVCGEVTIDINVVLEGKVKIGNNSRIGPNCVLKDCEIGDNVHVQANSFLEHARVANGCQIGPFARIRPNSVLEEGARVGNFVEIKNTHIGKGSKVNHLSYIGDSELGQQVNVGAGTITCNYDGAQKFKTHIEDGAFIGSGSQLVAPVKVGKNATIAAGSILNQDAPSGKLTLTQKLDHRTLSDWQRPEKNRSPKREILEEVEVEGVLDSENQKAS